MDAITKMMKAKCMAILRNAMEAVEAAETVCDLDRAISGPTDDDTRNFIDHLYRMAETYDKLSLYCKEYDALKHDLLKD